MAEPYVSRAERMAGGIYGVLVCDALGGPVQFSQPGTFRFVTDLQEVTPFMKPTGAWSDDGSMTLCIMQSIIDARGRDVSLAADIAYRFYRWHDQGYLVSDGPCSWDVGLATGAALRKWRKIFKDHLDVASVDVDDIKRTQQEIYESKQLNATRSQGNGSLMRVAPIGLAYSHNPDRAMRLAREQSDLTHPQPACGNACAVYTRLITEVDNLSFHRHLPEACKKHLASVLADMDISDRTLRERLRSRIPPGPIRDLSQWGQQPAEDVKSTGWVVDTLDAALWALFTTKTFKEGALAVVNLGGDSDTAGAVYGGLAGAVYGIKSIPKSWREGILKKDMVAAMVKEFTAYED